MAYFSDYIDLLVKVGDKRASTDPSFYWDWRDGQIITLRPVGGFTGKRDRQHHAVVRVKCGIAENLTKVTKFQDLKTSTEFLNLKKYIAPKSGSKLPWDFGYVGLDYFNTYRIRDWFLDFKDLLSKKILTQTQYEAIYDKSRQSDIIVLESDLTSYLKSEETDTRVSKDALEIASAIGTIDAGGTYTVGTSQTYSTLSSAIADLPADIGAITTPGNIIIQGNVDEPITESTAMTISLDTDVYTLTINAAAGVKHNGGAFGNGFRIDLTSYDSLKSSEASSGTTNNVIIQDLAIDASGTNNIGINIENCGDSGHIIVQRCIIKGDVDSSNGIVCFYNADNMIIRNNAVYGFTKDAVNLGFGIILNNSFNAKTYECYNNTVAKCYHGIGSDSSDTDGTLKVRNNLSLGNTAGDYMNTGNFDTIGKNVSGDSTSPDGATYQSWAGTANMVDYANNDFRLDADDATLNDADDLSAIGAPAQFNDDIQGQTRGWYSGCSAYIAAGGPYASSKSGSLTSSGSLLRAITAMYRSKFGSLTSIGAYARALNSFRSKAGDLTSSGAYSRLLTLLRSKTGSATFSGSYLRVLDFNRSKTGEISFSGIVTNVTDKTYSSAGVLAFTGSVTRSLLINRSKIGEISFFGSASVFGNEYAATGTLSLSGNVTREVGFRRGHSGTLSLYGDVPEAWKEMLFFGIRN